MPILEMKELERTLRLRRTNILSEIRQHLHRSDDAGKMVLANHSEEVDDWAEADLFNDTDIAQLVLEFSDLHGIDAALRRIKEGSYGVCTECGEFISAARMNANPVAQHCLSCQEKIEKRQGIAHGVSL